MNNDKKIDLTNKQLYATFVYIGAFIISIILLEHSRKKLKNEECLLSDKTCGSLSTFNRILILILSIIFLYLNYQHMDIYGTDERSLVSENLQIDASWLYVVAAIIVLYATINNSNNYENPEL